MCHNWGKLIFRAENERSFHLRWIIIYSRWMSACCNKIGNIGLTSMSPVDCWCVLPSTSNSDCISSPDTDHITSLLILALLLKWVYIWSVSLACWLSKCPWNHCSARHQGSMAPLWASLDLGITTSTEPTSGYSSENGNNSRITYGTSSVHRLRLIKCDVPTGTG